LTCDFWAENTKNNLDVLHREENKAVRWRECPPYRRKTVAERGHPVVVVRSDVGHPSSRRNIMLNYPERSFLDRVAAVLSPIYRIIKVVFDFYTLVHMGH
jgi:hypothetical protein